MSNYSAYFLDFEDEWRRELRDIEADAYEDEARWQREEQESYFHNIEADARGLGPSDEDDDECPE